MKRLKIRETITMLEHNESHDVTKFRSLPVSRITVQRAASKHKSCTEI